MVVLQRNEVNRSHSVSVLAALLALAVLVTVVLTYSGRSGTVQIALVLLGAGAVATIALAGLQFLTTPKKSQVLIFYRDDGMVVATNALHEGYKLRFLRDILGETVSAFSDEDRLHWKDLEADGFYAGIYVRGARKLVMTRLCTMIFDDVFIGDQYGRWEYYDSSCTADPSFSKRVTPPLKKWKGTPIEQA